MLSLGAALACLATLSSSWGCIGKEHLHQRQALLPLTFDTGIVVEPRLLPSGTLTPGLAIIYILRNQHTRELISINQIEL
jgi:hypothetical protein